MNVDLVFEGGGAKGIAFAGGLKALEEFGYKPKSLAGTSAGAMVAALVAVGYSAEDIKNILFELDFNAMKDESFMDSVEFVKKAFLICFDKGIYDGLLLKKWLDEKLKNAPRPAKYFGDLETDLRVIASDISRARMLVLPRDVQLFGLDPRELSISDAVRMSMSIPFFFKPVIYPDPITRKNSYIVDGGILSNFPIHLFDSKTTPRWPTFGFNLMENEGPYTYHKITGPISMFKAMFSTMLSARDKFEILNADYVRTINVPAGFVRAADFDLSQEDKFYLLKVGEDATRLFLQSWNWDRYVQQYRSNKIKMDRSSLLCQETNPSC
jgi:NTE family protein